MTQTSEKRIYSLNLGAYLLSTTHIMPEIRRDEETGSFYLIFPQTKEIKKGIHDFKQANPKIEIHSFLNAVKQIRQSIKIKEALQ